MGDIFTLLVWVSENPLLVLFATDRLTSDSLMPPPTAGYFFTNTITDGITDGTPVGNNGLVQAPLCNSASQNILPCMGKTIFCNW